MGRYEAERGAIDPRLSFLQAHMRRDWNRRISQEYRYWMSDGIEDDAAMWETGRRDFKTLMEDLPLHGLKNQTALEIGCGVGRLLLPASELFQTVIGIDISDIAIEIAAQKLSGIGNVQLWVGEGTNLKDIDPGSMDVVYSCGIMSHIPVRVAVCNILEINRVLVRGGWAILQLYLGQTIETIEEDSLAIRSYNRERLIDTVEAAGFSVQSIRPFILPFDAGATATGFGPYVLSLQKKEEPTCDEEAVQKKMVVAREREASPDWPGSRTEYCFVLRRVEQHVNAGRYQAAKATLEYAITSYKNAEAGAFTLLEVLSELSP